MKPDKDKKPDEEEFDEDTLARLSEQADQEGFLLSPLPNQMAEISEPLPAGSVIDGYELREVISTGGKATVYKAVQSKVAMREVALKIYHFPSLDISCGFVQNEIETLANLNHPNLVSIIDAGFLPDGRKYVVLPLLRGKELGDYFQDGTHTAVEIATTFQKIALAVHDLHLKGFVHCDLKPSNILVDDVGTPTITDFDAACLAGTLPDLIQGTVGYLAPEQITDGHGATDLRIDIYSLGATLYEVLCGRIVFPDGSSSGKLTATIYDIPQAPDSIDSKIPVELSQICMRCLQKEPSDRFQSAGDLSNALGSFIEVQSDSAVSKNTETSAGRVTFLFCLLLVLLFGFVYAPVIRDSKFPMTEYVAPPDRLRTRSDREGQRQRRSAYNRELLRLGHFANRDPTHAYRQLLDETVCPVGFRSFSWSALVQSVDPVVADWIADEKGLWNIELSADGKLVATSSSSGIRVWESDSGALIATSPLTPDPNLRLGFDANNRFMVFCQNDQAYRLHIDSNAIEELTHTCAGKPTAITSLQDGGRYLVGDETGNVECWNHGSGSLVWSRHVAKHSIIGMRVADAEDVCGLLTEVGKILICDVENGGGLRSHQIDKTHLDVERFRTAELSADLQAAAFCSDFDSAIVWEIETAKSLAVFNQLGPFPDLSFANYRSNAKENRFLASGRNRVDLWENGEVDKTVYRSPVEASPTKANGGSVTQPISVASTVVGDRIAIGRRDGKVIISNVSNTLFHTWKTPRPTVAGLEFSSDGRFLASYSGGGTVVLHHCETGEVMWQSAPGGRVLDLHFSRDCQQIRARLQNELVVVLNSETGESIGKTKVPRKSRKILDVDGKVLLGIAGDQAAWLYPQIESQGIEMSISSRSINGAMESVCRDTKSGLIAIAHDSSMVTVGSILADGKFRIANERRLEQRVRRMQFSPDAEQLVTGLHDGGVVVWSTSDLEELVRMTPNSSPVGGIAFTPDGSEMVTAHFDGELLFWDPLNWEPRLSVRTELRPIRDIAFSPDGQTLVVGGKGAGITVAHGLRRERQWESADSR